MPRRLLFVKSRRASFIELDQRLLAERFDVHVIHQPGRIPHPLRVIREVWRADVVVGWWASWHTVAPFTLAWLLRRPSLLIVGGFDTAAEPEIGYGYQRGGIRARLSRFTMRRARILMTNSEYSRGEVERNCRIAAERVNVVHHGVEDTAPPAADKQPVALTVGIVDRMNLTRKGLRAFVEAAAALPEVEFVVAGALIEDGAEMRLRALATGNVTITGWLEDEQLQELFARAAVYVQASRHEGFGVSVAEAMLARCVPVVSRAGALPEVVGETGVIIDGVDGRGVADGVRRALALAADPSAGEAARARVLERFTVQRRRQGLFDLLDRLLAGTRTGAGAPAERVGSN